MRSEALEQLEDLKSEISSDTPKQSRLKASLRELWNVVKDVAIVAHAVTELAVKLGVQITPLL